MRPEAARLIYGIGTDLLRIDRCEALYARQGQRALTKLLMPEERAALPAAKSIGYGIARAFAAKEAFVKALGTGFHGVSYQDVGALREPKARPRLIVSRAMQARLVSLSWRIASARPSRLSAARAPFLSAW